MRYRCLTIAIVFFFLCINTIAYWEGRLDIMAFPVFTALFIYYLVLLALFFRHLVLAYHEKPKNRQRLGILTALAIVLVLTFLKPHGLIDFDRLAGEDGLVASYEGPANCSILKFKTNGSFIKKNICFGVSELKGRYEQKGDTLFFKVAAHATAKQQDAFAVIQLSTSKNKQYIGTLVTYRDKTDTVGHPFAITINKLSKP